MLSTEEWTTIRDLYKRGYGKKTIALMLGVSRNTVRRVLASKEPPKYVRKKQKEKKLDPYKEKIQYMYFEQKKIGIKIYNELISRGYTGSLTTLYKYLKKLKEDK
ncbi:MAG: helix-turn-helix domain-containing protein [Bacillota bacterium]